MTFLHDDADFADLVQIVATERRLAPVLVEKDYWVIHVLWSVLAGGFELWFKGGTSLSKGFGCIDRFSEDLDVQIEAGPSSALPAVTSWKSESRAATSQRRAWFERLAAVLTVPGARVELDLDTADKAWRQGNLLVHYARRHSAELTILSPFVRLEVGRGRVTPFLRRDLSSFLHDKLAALGELSAFEDNRPRDVRCLHPLVTLLEKLDALHRRVPSERAEPAAFVRHFEDCAHVIQALERLTPAEGVTDARRLAADMLQAKQIAALPDADDPAFAPTTGSRWDAIHAVHAAIAPMFWGARLSLEDACAAIRGWVGNVMR